MDMPKIAAVVVLYNPDSVVMGNLNSYINQVDKLYAVDNSENINSMLVEKIKCIKDAEYISNAKNLGIAAALNIGAKKAIEEGFEFLLTMDQDSRISENFADEMIKILEKNKNIGILAPFIIHAENQQKPPDVKLIK